MKINMVNSMFSSPRVGRNVLEHIRLLLGVLQKLQVIISGYVTKEYALGAYSVAQKMRLLYRHSGLLFLGRYLKEAHWSLVKYLAGDLHISPIIIGRTRCGIPKIIPPYHRKIIRLGGDRGYTVCQFYLSVFSFYKLVKLVNKNMDVSSITTPGKVSQLYPTNAVSKGGITMEKLVLWLTGGGLKRTFRKYLCKVEPFWRAPFTYFPRWTSCPSTKGQSALASFREEITDFYGTLNPMTEIDDMLVCWKFTHPATWGVGRLVGLNEPLKKVRIIAIENSFIQSYLTPFQSWAMSILRKIPSDGTFNQGLPLEVLVDTGFYGCADLKSATDRFPSVILKLVILGFLGLEASSAWYNIIFARQFKVGSTDTYVRYRAGQHMGSCGSWAIFSVCHHAIIQFCAQCCGYKRWFADYALLGDDILLLNEKVYSVYLDVIDLLGVEVQRSKSLISSTTCEFAKKIRVDHLRRDISPVSIKMLIATHGFDTVTTVRTMFPLTSWSNCFRLMGAGYKILSKINTEFLPSFWKKVKRRMFSPSGPFACAPPLWFAYCNNGTYLPPNIDIYISKYYQDKYLDKLNFDLEIIGSEEPSWAEEIIIYRPWLHECLSAEYRLLAELVKVEPPPLSFWMKRGATIPRTSIITRKKDPFDRMDTYFWYKTFKIGVRLSKCYPLLLAPLGVP
uniref:RNA-dependent RNA polymerase n=1 Tax=Asian bayberry mitovirus TaxID=2933108 RepID=A0A9C7GWM9_9VIRU|nr:RNA-dependent RNA polymerase [Asian bayberry mitovirus]CAI5383963.1 RNA-dependent RNA polymerase [Asian bayberry mitovirus]